MDGTGADSLVLAAENLAAARGYRVLFQDVNLRLIRGDILELRGPNGSGKSTLLRVLAGLTRPMAGKVILGGGPEDTLRRYSGHLDAIKPSETAIEQARFWARFFGAGDHAASQALDRMGLKSRADVPGRGLSAGQRRRLALTRMLIDPRPIWLLDEPVASLDAEGRALVMEIVAEHAAAGGIVVAAMHGEGFAGAKHFDVSVSKAGVAA
jgi:heme exporter protein A